MRQTTLVLIFPLLIAGCTSGCTAGGSDARNDLAQNHLEVRVYGLPRPSDPLYAQLLKERYKIELNSVGGCLVTKTTRRNADAYNRVMTPEIERRFGPGILEQIEAEAQQKSPATRPAV